MRCSRPDTWLDIQGVIRYGEKKEIRTYRVSAMVEPKRKPRRGFEHGPRVRWCGVLRGWLIL
jgi:hypothetical protein